MPVCVCVLAPPSGSAHKHDQSLTKKMYALSASTKHCTFADPALVCFRLQTTVRDYLEYTELFDSGLGSDSALSDAFSRDVRSALEMTLQNGCLPGAVSESAGRMRMALPTLPATFVAVFDRHVAAHLRSTATLASQHLKRYYSASDDRCKQWLRRYHRAVADEIARGVHATNNNSGISYARTLGGALGAGRHGRVGGGDGRGGGGGAGGGGHGGGAGGGISRKTR